jgi:hypothetical protein
VPGPRSRSTYRPDYDAITRARVPLTLAAGEESLAARYGYARTAPLIAERLNRPMVIFPGHHTSYHFRADDFAAALTAALHNPADTP